MTKFYDEVKDSLYLPIKSNRPILPYDKIDPFFYRKYSLLFSLIKELNMIANSSKVSLINAVYSEKVDLYNKLVFNLKFLYECGFDYDNMLMHELEKFLLVWGECFDLMYELGIYTCDKKNYFNYMELFNNAVNEVLLSQRKIIKIKLPNVWLISSRDFLFNAFSKKHCDSDFSDIYQRYNKLFYECGFDFQGGKEVSDLIDIIKDLDNGYVLPSQVENLTGNGEYVSFNGKVFDSKYKMLIKGALELERDYYMFLKKLYTHTFEPYKQLDKVRELTKDNYDDALIRCCSAAKVCSGNVRNIVTSSFDYKRDFEEYSIKGYDLSFSPPIRLNYEKKCIDEYSDEFLLIRSMR